jgi:hypothetical protein
MNQKKQLAWGVSAEIEELQYRVRQVVARFVRGMERINLVFQINPDPNDGPDDDASDGAKCRRFFLLGLRGVKGERLRRVLEELIEMEDKMGEWLRLLSTTRENVIDINDWCFIETANGVAEMAAGEGDTPNADDGDNDSGGRRELYHRPE